MNIIALVLIIGIVKYLSEHSSKVFDIMSKIALLMIILSMAGIIDLSFLQGCLNNVKMSEIIARFE
jgi:hypothetical protein|tara:strand:- start:1319 stop:1516 length:198 start_codon:yes stop_codon:yes gene_type:complete